MKSTEINKKAPPRVQEKVAQYLSGLEAEPTSTNHASYQRLAKAAAVLRGIYGEAEITKELRLESQQQVNNWQRRGVSKDGALDAERYIGCPASWILDGEFPIGCSWEKVIGVPEKNPPLKHRREIDELTRLAKTLDAETVKSLVLLVKKLQANN